MLYFQLTEISLTDQKSETFLMLSLNLKGPVGLRDQNPDTYLLAQA